MRGLTWVCTVCEREKEAGCALLQLGSCSIRNNCTCSIKSTTLINTEEDILHSEDFPADPAGCYFCFSSNLVLLNSTKYHS